MGWSGPFRPIEVPRIFSGDLEQWLGHQGEILDMTESNKGSDFSKDAGQRHVQENLEFFTSGFDVFHCEHKLQIRHLGVAEETLGHVDLRLWCSKLSRRTSKWSLWEAVWKMTSPM